MTGCPEWMDAVAGCALGDAAEPALAAHLAVCPACAEALHESRRAAARIDDALRRRVWIEPPLYGPARVMASISARNRAGPSARWRWAAVGSVAAILLAIILWMRRPEPPPADVAALEAWRSPTASLLRPPVPAAWNTMPKFGQGFLAIKPSGELHAQ